MKLILYVVLFVLPAAVIISSCTIGKGISKTKTPETSGKQIYQDWCKKCHGKNGQIPANNVVLKESIIPREAVYEITKKGRGFMPGFEGELTEEELQAVTDYVIQLRESPR